MFLSFVGLWLGLLCCIVIVLFFGLFVLMLINFVFVWF